MQIGMIGLGKMGANMATRLCRANIHVVGYDASGKSVDALINEPGFDGAYSLDALLNALPLPRKVWVMLPAGKATNQTLDELRLKMAPGDLVVNGGNSFYKETVVAAEAFRLAEIQFVDVGVSGGVHGLENGYCMMVGGESTAIQRLARTLTALAPEPNQWLHTGPCGAGHYVKMVHNGIEYSMMQGYAEGFELMAKSEYRLDLGKIADVWMHGSVVRSWLLELAVGALQQDPKLEKLKGYVQDSGEGRWMIQDAIDKDVPVPTLTAALFTRFRSRQEESFAEKMLAALRNAFGGHSVRR